MRRLTRHSLAAAFLLASAGVAAAQTPNAGPEALTPGNRALSIELPSGGGGSFGLWHVVAPDRSRGLFLNVTASTDRTFYSYNPTTVQATQSLVSASIGPRWRRYVTRAPSIAPFVESGLSLGVSYTSVDYDTASTVENVFLTLQQGSHEWDGLLAGDLGIGAEWFPLHNMSVAGRTGLRFTGRLGRMTTGPAQGFGGSNTHTTWSANLATFVSALTFQLYF